MKLREFLNYRTNCLTCGLELNTIFHSKKKQKHKVGTNRLLVQMDLKTLKKGQKHYKVGYSIDYDTNDFCIEFFDGEGKEWYNDFAPLFLLKRFKNLDKYHGKYSITKHCNICNNYWYSSNSFDLNYQSANLGDLSIQDEHGIFFKHHQDGYKVYKLHTFYDKNESTFHSTKISFKHYEDMRIKHSTPQFTSNLITTYSIPFIKSPDDIMEKLNKLLLFS